MSTKKLTEKGERIRRRMIDATVRILQQQGFRQTTVRAIAREADVNIASVRYYFGSKEALISAALEYMVGNLETVLAYLDDPDLPAKERMKKYMIAYFKLARQHPSLFRSVTHPSAPETKDTYFIYLSLLHNQCWDKVIRNVAEMTGYTDQKDLNLKAMQLFSALEFPILLDINQPDSFISAYTDEDTLNRYIDILLDSADDSRERSEYLRKILQKAK